VALSALQKDAQNVRRAAEDALAGALAGTGVPLDGDRRCEQPELNLVPALIGRWAAIAPQLGGGNGGELYESAAHRPKFCSAFSSCALAVNTFGRFDDTAPLPLPAGTFPGGVRFEAQRTADVRGYKPNLDLVAEPAEGPWLFAESKCLEYLRPHTTAFSDAFVAKADRLLSAETAAFYAAFAANKKAGAHTLRARPARPARLSRPLEQLGHARRCRAHGARRRAARPLPSSTETRRLTTSARKRSRSG
jgi:hypothetical protein